jgi:hypothetical protein
MALQPLWALAAFQFPDLFTIGRTPWTSDQLVARPLPKPRTVGFEPTITVSERVKTVHALDRVATVTGSNNYRNDVYTHMQYSIYNNSFQ